jgi:hypothetical protein
MPTISDIYKTMLEHEDIAKTAAEKKASEKSAILAPSGAGGGSPAAAIEDVIGETVAATKVRIKAKLQESAGAEQAAVGLAADADDEKPSDSQAPIIGDKMPPAGEKGVSTSAETAAAVGAGKAAKAEDKAEEKTAEQDKEAAEKLAAEYDAAGRIMAQGFWSELNRLSEGGEAK